MGKFSVGPSSYGDLRGVEQFVATARIALQVLSVIADFNAWQKDRGATGALSVNEGMRSRARQSYLWAVRFILAIVVAPPFTSRHDEVRHGNAIDFGITMPDGTNRALTATEFAKLHALVEARGGTWTGANFGEPWHHEMATRTEQLAPYPDAADRVAGTAPTSTTNTLITIAETEDMIRLLQDPTTKNYYLENMLTGVAEPVTEKDDVTDLTIVLKGKGRIAKRRLDQLNERFFRKVGPSGLFNLGVRAGIFTAPKENS